MTKSITIHLLAFLWLSLIPDTGIAQFDLKGKVTDADGAVSFANVILNDQADQIITGGVTNEDGSFELKAPEGTYKLIISYVGYENYELEVVLDKNTVLDDIVMSVQGNDLEGVDIVAKKILVNRKVDRLIFNIEDNISVAGGDAMDALRVSPGIVVNDGQITMIGKNGMRVMIDGRLIQLTGDELTTFLASIPADDIKEIEIITTPPAKYNAEGNSGMINIIYKRGRNNSWNNRTSLSYTQAELGRYSLGNNFTLQKNKVNMLLSLNGTMGDFDVERFGTIFYEDGPLKRTRDEVWKRDNLSGRIMLDYQINNKSTIGFQYLGGTSEPDATMENVETKYNLSDAFDFRLLSNTNSDHKNDNHVGNIHYQTQLDTLGKSLSIDLDYFEFVRELDRDAFTDELDENDSVVSRVFSNRTTSNENLKNYNARVDIRHPLKFMELSYGVNANFSNNSFEINSFNTISEVPVFNPLQSDDFEYTENKQAIYVNTFKNFNEKWGMQVGLRLENTQIEGVSKVLDTTNTDEYLRLFPTFYTSYRQSDESTFSFSYGRRINRPAYHQLSPARIYFTNNSYVEGNPLLQPSFSDNFEFSHNFLGKFVTNIFLNIESDGFDEISFVNNETQEQVYTNLNFYTQYNYGISEFYTFNKIPWWNSQSSVYLTYTDSKFHGEGNVANVQSGFRLYTDTYNTFALNKSRTISAQLNLWYSSPFKRNLYETDQYYGIEVGFRFRMLENALQLSVTGYDLLNSGARQNTTVVNNIKQTNKSYFSNRYLRVALSYNFGNKKINVRERNFGNEAERRRAGN